MAKDALINPVHSTVLLTVMTCMLGAFLLWKQNGTPIHVSNAPQVTVASQSRVESDLTVEGYVHKRKCPNIQKVSNQGRKELRTGLFSNPTKLSEGDTTKVSSLNRTDMKYEVLFYCPPIEKKLEYFPSELSEVVLSEPRNVDEGMEINSEISCETIIEDPKKQLSKMSFVESRCDSSTYQSSLEMVRDIEEHCSSNVLEVKELDNAQEIVFEIIAATCHQIDHVCKDLVITAQSHDKESPELVNEVNEILDTDDFLLQSECGSVVVEPKNEISQNTAVQEKDETLTLPEENDKDKCQQGSVVVEPKKEISHNTTVQEKDEPLTLPEENDKDNKCQQIAIFNDMEAIWSYLGKTGPMREAEVNRLVLMKPGTRRSPIQRALEEENPGMTESLLRLGASLEFQDRVGRFPIHKAAMSGNVELLDVLKRWGSDLSRKDSLGYTPLHRAASTGQTEAVKWLLEQGVPIDSTTWAGWTPLHLAACNGHLDTSDLLINSGAEINMKDNDGWTPLYLAKVYHRKYVIKLLEENGGLS